MERVKGIAFVDRCIFNGSRSSVQISSKFCLIYSNI